MSVFEVAAALVCLSSLFGYLNHLIFGHYHTPLGLSCALMAYVRNLLNQF